MWSSWGHIGTQWCRGRPWMALEWPKETLLARDLWKCHRSTHISIFIISEKALLARRGWRVFIMEKEFIKKSSFLHRVFQMFWVYMKWVLKHSCAFPSLVFAGISCSLQNSPISLEIAVILLVQVAAAGSHSVGFGILTFLLYPPVHFDSFAGFFFGPKDPLAIFLSLLALRVCRANSLCDCPEQIFGSGFISLREALSCVSHHVQVTHHFHLGTSSLQAFPAWISVPRADIYAKLCWTIPVCPQASISSNFLMCWVGLGGSFLSFHISGNTFPHESGKSLCSIPHFLLFLISSLLCHGYSWIHISFPQVHCKWGGPITSEQLVVLIIIILCTEKSKAQKNLISVHN